MYLRTKPYHLQNLNLAENKFDYIWEYRYEDDPIDIDCSVTTPTSTCYAGTNLSLCKDGTSQYDPSCQQCNCTEEEIWQPAQLTGSPTSTETINFPAFRRSSSNRIKFRYRLKHKLYGQLGPPSAATSYITVFKAPPVVNHNEDPNPILNSATATVYNQATDDIKIEHVECKGDSTGRFTIKHVVGDGKYYYNIRGPLPAGSKWPHNENGSSAQTYNLNGENLPAPNQNNSTTWLTFPDVLTDPAKPAGFFAGRYVLVVENLDERSSTGTTDGFGDILERKCFDTVYFTIKEPLAAVTYSIADTSNYNGYGVSCRTAADGWVQLGAAGGIGPYTYYLKANTPGAILLDNVDGYFSGLAALDATGNPITYQYYAKDALDCVTNIVSNTFTLLAPEQLVFKSIGYNTYTYGDSTYHIQCYGGTDTLYLHATGGVAPYTFFLDGLEKARQDSTEVVAVAGFARGKYTLTVTDDNQCTATSSEVELEEPTIISAKSISIVDPSCFGKMDGSLSVTATGGIPYPDGSYDFKLHYLDSASIGSNYPDFNTQPSSNLRSDSVLYENLLAGRYRISIGGVYGCVVLKDTIISQPDPVSMQLTLRRDVRCKEESNGQAALRIVGGTAPYQVDVFHTDNMNSALFSFEGVAEAQLLSLSGLLTGQYEVRVTDSLTCELDPAQSHFNIYEPDETLAFIFNAAEDQQPISCQGAHDGTIRLQAGGGWQEGPYRYDTDTTNLQPHTNYFTGLGPGEYTFWVEDSGGCLQSMTVTFEEPAAFTIEAFSLKEVSCFGESDGGYTLELQGGTPPYQMSLDGGSWEEAGSRYNLSAGTYTLSLADSRGCSLTQNFTIGQPDKLTITGIAGSPATCGEANGSASVQIEGGAQPYRSILWTNGAGDTISNSLQYEETALFAGSYRVKVVDANGCDAQTLLGVSNATGPQIDSFLVASVSCHGRSDGAAHITYSGGSGTISLKWFDKDNQQIAEGETFTGRKAGMYSVTVSDENSCSDTRAFSIGEPDPLNIRWALAQDPICTGQSDGMLLAEVTGGNGHYTYSWEGTRASGNLAQDLAAGTYRLTVTDAKSCSETAEITLADPASISPAIADTLWICSGQTITLDAGYPGSTYDWSSNWGFSSSQQSISVSMPGNYVLKVTTAEGCEGERQFVIGQDNNLLQARFMMPTEAYAGDTVVLVDISYPEPGQTSWVYDKEVQLLRRYELYEEVIFPEAGTYTITQYASLGGCQASLTKQINILGADGKAAGEQQAGDKLIQSFSVVPNPTDGAFAVSVGLQEKAEVVVRLIGLSGSGIIRTYTGSQAKNYTFNFEEYRLAAGTYLVAVAAGNESRTLRVVIY